MVEARFAGCDIRRIGDRGELMLQPVLKGSPEPFVSHKHWSWPFQLSHEEEGCLSCIENGP
jgi:hypothetical protein